MEEARPEGAAIMTARPTLPEPIIVDRFWRNRRGEAVVTSLRQYESHVLCDLRVCFSNKDGQLQPTKKGLAVVVVRLPELAAAVNKALAKARALGLIEAADATEGADHG
jgi:hypothetical protein